MVIVGLLRADKGPFMPLHLAAGNIEGIGLAEIGAAELS
jgi:hypothetical protein